MSLNLGCSLAKYFLGYLSMSVDNLEQKRSCLMNPLSMYTMKVE